jgi:hypothetical protein
LLAALLPAVLALSLAACGDSPTAPTSTTVIAFGDSITFGVGTTGANNYVALTGISDEIDRQDGTVQPERAMVLA